MATEQIGLNLLTNKYAILLLVSLFGVGFNIFYFLEKVKEKLKNKKQELISSFSQKFGDNPKTQDVVFIFNNLIKQNDEYSAIESVIDLNLDGGIGFISGCVLGIFSSVLTFISQDLILTILFLSGLILVVSIVRLMFWHIKN